jgi:hypothetical protein
MALHPNFPDLNLRVTLETDTPPSAGYLIDSSEFTQLHR